MANVLRCASTAPIATRWVWNAAENRIARSNVFFFFDGLIPRRSLTFFPNSFPIKKRRSRYSSTVSAAPVPRRAIVTMAVAATEGTREFKMGQEEGELGRKSFASNLLSDFFSALSHFPFPSPRPRL